jgi:hypothetical protein
MLWRGVIFKGDLVTIFVKESSLALKFVATFVDKGFVTVVPKYYNCVTSYNVCYLCHDFDLHSGYETATYI